MDQDRVTLTITPDPDTLPRVRGFIDNTLHSWRLPELTIDAAVLAANELVVNAMIHTRASCRLQIARGDMLRIEVADTSTNPPRATIQTRPGPDRPGNGLKIVDQFTDFWGHDITASGKTTWCELLI